MPRIYLRNFRVRMHGRSPALGMFNGRCAISIRKGWELAEKRIHNIHIMMAWDVVKIENRRCPYFSSGSDHQFGSIAFSFTYWVPHTQKGAGLQGSTGRMFRASPFGVIGPFDVSALHQCMFFPWLKNSNFRNIRIESKSCIGNCREYQFWRLRKKSKRLSLRAARSNLTHYNWLYSLDCFVTTFLAMTRFTTFYQSINFGKINKLLSLGHEMDIAEDTFSDQVKKQVQPLASAVS